MEIWKNIEDTEYDVSTFGNVRNKFKSRLKPCVTACNGYASVVLWHGNKSRTKPIHRLVAEAFLEESKRDYTVNHKDGNKLNNNVTNLEWMSLQENLAHAKVNGLMCKGESHGMAILTEEDVLNILSLFADGLSDLEISRKFNVARNTIYDIREGKTWTHIPGFRTPVVKKLFGEDIPKIRAMSAAGLSNSEIGKKFNVHNGTIHSILSGKTWKNY